MSCQFGIYPDRKAGIEEWDFLIYQQDHLAPRDILSALSPFLRTFHAEQGMSETGFLAAGLAWYLADLRLDSIGDTVLPKVEFTREIQAEIAFFYKISPGYVDTFRINEVLEWMPIAVLEIPRQTAAVDAL
tara:strand:- start:22 stop:414 length:393 start_codon:yes stop_codon:yes gene_type:complete